ncbi:MAG: Uma2 family endonuclease [Planctomycetes bacterium]|nr:Uma2 family endonuclease [Planctomycetota bacterium]
MAATAEHPEFVVLYGISWQQYEAILAALGEHHLRHSYDRGTLEMRSIVYGVSWQEYEKLLAALPEHSFRHSYDRGTLEMMTPLKSHDWTKTLLGRMVEMLSLELSVPIQSVGSTTLRGEAAERGLQPDEAYYIAHEPEVRGKDEYDPDRDPPPDLVVEVDVTSSCVNRMPIYAALRVPELWRHDGEKVIFYLLDPSGNYVKADRSLAFPMLQPEDINRFLDLRHTMDENSLIRSFVEWIRKQMKPE